MERVRFLLGYVSLLLSECPPSVSDIINQEITVQAKVSARLRSAMVLFSYFHVLCPGPVKVLEQTINPLTGEVLGKAMAPRSACHECTIVLVSHAICGYASCTV